MSASPPRNSSAPKRVCDGSRLSNDGDRRGAHVDARRRWLRSAAPAPAHRSRRRPAARQAAMPATSQRRRARVHATRLRRARRARLFGGSVFLEQLGELLGHGAAEFLGIDDGDGAAIVARHVMADADGDQFDRRAGLDLLDHPAQMAFEIIAGIDRQRGIVDRRAVGNHHQDLALLGARRAGAYAPSRAPRRRCFP